jgi:hypothetical protein
LLGAAAAMGADRIAAAATDAVAIFHFMAFLLNVLNGPGCSQ